MSKKSNAIPDNVMSLLAAADKRNGFPAGTLRSIMQQEVGGNFDRYLQDPTAYHYEKNAEGKRVAGHTGKISTAFGPFGLLESTAADPGYGVVPLRDKSLEEQVRFAGDYLAARSKKAGSLQAGLAGYGEGEKYSQQVTGRIGGGAATALAQLAQAPQVVEVMADAPIQQASLPSPEVPVQVAQQGEDPWIAFQRQMQKPEIKPTDLAYGQSLEYVPQPMQIPDFQSMARYAQANLKPDFSRFTGFKGRV